MGLTAGPTYTTEEGFEISPLYLSVSGFRFLQLSGSLNYQAVVYVEGFKSREDKYAGRKPIALPAYLANAEGFVSTLDFIRKGAFGVFYHIVKQVWTQAGYTVEDIKEMGQCDPQDFVFDCSGFNVDGFACSGYNRDGFDKDGFNKDGWDRWGYNRQGYDADGYNRQGYNAQGFNKDGFNRFGYDAEGYDRDGYNNQGYNRAGFDRDGYNRFGLDVNGNPRPQPTIMPSTITVLDLSGSEVTPPDA
jgi:hypothetical protein